MNLIELLKLVKDFRAARGRRHELWLVLLSAIMGAMSGYWGYRPLAFVCRKSSSGIAGTIGSSSRAATAVLFNLPASVDGSGFPSFDRTVQPLGKHL